MSNNLLELINENISGDVISKLSEFLGESQKNTTSALSSAIPSMLAGLVSKSADSQGASTIFNLLSQGNHDGGILNNLVSAFSGGEGTNKLLSTGASLLNSIFGQKADGVANLISSASGISKTSSTSLMGALMPIVFGVLGKTVKSQGIASAAGLATFLAGQSGFLKNFLPAGLSNILGLTDTVKHTAATASRVVEEESDGMGWLPWLLLPLLAALGWGLWKYIPKPVVPDVSVEAPAVPAIPEVKAPEVVAPIVEKISEFFEKTLSTGYAIKGAADGIEGKLITFIEDANKPVDKDTWFSMNGITFDTDKATLKPESNTQMTNIAEILKAFPNVKIKIGGYTDNTGDAKHNLALSSERAKTIQKGLIDMGIDAGRLDAEGYGQEHPVATNDTEEGRQQNRRIDVRVTEK